MKRLYHILCLVALIGVFALGGFAGFLFATGRLNAQRIDQIGMVLRGEFPKPVVAASQPATQPTSAPSQLSRAEMARLAAQKEYLDLAGERLKVEAEQRRMLNERIQLDLTRQLEESQARRTEPPEPKKKPVARPAVPQELPGIEKELEVFGSMDPKLARDLLMKRKEPEAIQLFMRLEPSRVKKIVDACKTEEERDWVGRILSQIHNMDNEMANGVDGPNASSR